MFKLLSKVCEELNENCKEENKNVDPRILGEIEKQFMNISTYLASLVSKEERLGKEKEKSDQLVRKRIENLQYNYSGSIIQRVLFRVNRNSRN